MTKNAEQRGVSRYFWKLAALFILDGKFSALRAHVFVLVGFLVYAFIEWALLGGAMSNDAVHTVFFVYFCLMTMHNVHEHWTVKKFRLSYERKWKGYAEDVVYGRSEGLEQKMEHVREVKRNLSHLESVVRGYVGMYVVVAFVTIYLPVAAGIQEGVTLALSPWVVFFVSLVLAIVSGETEQQIQSYTKKLEDHE